MQIPCEASASDLLHAELKACLLKPCELFSSSTATLHHLVSILELGTQWNPGVPGLSPNRTANGQQMWGTEVRIRHHQGLSASIPSIRMVVSSKQTQPSEDKMR